MFPGGNILAMAHRIICFNQVQYSRFLGRTTNEIGYDVDTFSDPVDLQLSVQPIPRERYTYLGLDFQKSYVNFYTFEDIQDVSRDRTGDLFEFNGRRYQVMSNNDWKWVDGWKGTLAVDVGAAEWGGQC